MNENPDPSLDTTTKGMNAPGVPLDEWSLEQLENIRPTDRERVSKHRAGRQPKRSAIAKRRLQRAQRQRIAEYLDAKALERAIDG